MMMEELGGVARVGSGMLTRQLTTFNRKTRQKTVKVHPGERVTVGEVKGSGYVGQLWMTVPGWFFQHWNVDAPIDQSILKTLILRIHWDGSARAAVECPVGDFFGNGLCEAQHFTSRFFGYSSGGFYCSFPMPYRKGFRIELENRDSRIAPEVFMNVLYQETAAVEEHAGYLHAQFRTGENKGPEPLVVCEVEGRGRGKVAGVTLSMQGEPMNYLSFLEAPEEIWVDGDWDENGGEPRIVGTGLEDYFLGGWYFRDGPFAGPLHGVVVKDALRSSVAMYRAYDRDAIHFDRRIRFTFVNPWAADRLRPFRHSSCAFLYLEGAEGVGPEVPAREKLLCWYRVRDCDKQSIP